MGVGAGTIQLLEDVGENEKLVKERQEGCPRQREQCMQRHRGVKVPVEFGEWPQFSTAECYVGGDGGRMLFWVGSCRVEYRVSTVAGVIQESFMEEVELEGSVLK